VQAGARVIEVVAAAGAPRAVEVEAEADRADLRPLFFGFRSPKPVNSNPSW
jgi:hypothetical protein